MWLSILLPEELILPRLPYIIFCITFIALFIHPMTAKCVFLSMFLLLIIHGAWADTQADSLQKKLDAVPEKDKIEILQKLAAIYTKDSAALGLSYARRALALARKYQNQEQEAEALSRIAKVCYFKGDYPQALEYYNLSLTLSQKIKNYRLSKNNLYNIGYTYLMTGNPTKALEYFTMTNELIKKSHEPPDGNVLFEIARLQKKKGDRKKAMEGFQKALAIFNKNNDENSQSGVYNELGIMYGDWGWMEKSLLNYLKALNIQERLNDSTAMAYTFTNMAGIYFNWFNREKAFEYQQKALDIFKRLNNKWGIAYVLNSIGLNYLNMRKYGQALNYFRQALAYKKIIGDKQGEAFVLGNIGEIYSRQGNTEDAVLFLDQSLALSEQVSDNYGICTTLNSKAKLLFKQGLYKQALTALKKSLTLSQKIDLKENTMSCYHLLSGIYEKTGNSGGALKYYKLYSSIYDSVFAVKNQEAMAEMQIKYETTKKENQISLLNSENRLKSLRLKENRMLTTGFATGLLVVVVLMGAILYFYFQRTKAYKHLVIKNRELMMAEKQLRKDNELIHYHANPLPGKEETHNLFSDELRQNILQQLRQMMQTDKIYLKPDLNLNDVAKQLNTNTAYLSRIINDNFGCNFNHFINEQRISEARIMLADETFNKMSIEGIAQTVGFKSKSAFNIAFKKFTGVTPSYFQKSIRHLDA